MTEPAPSPPSATTPIHAPSESTFPVLTPEQIERVAAHGTLRKFQADHLAFSILRKVFGDQYRFFGLGETLSL